MACEFLSGEVNCCKLLYFVSSDENEICKVESALEFRLKLTNICKYLDQRLVVFYTFIAESHVNYYAPKFVFSRNLVV